MDRVFVWMMAAAILHIFEEYVYPGGFLRWMRILITSASLTVVDAVIINGAFLGLVFSPLMDAPAKTPILSISIPSLLLINGMLHVLGTFITKRYSPGVITAVLLYFPIGGYAIFELARSWQLPSSIIVEGILLGAGWHLIPFARLGLQRIMYAS
jgi:Protein of unknown function with HXXEE motif